MRYLEMNRQGILDPRNYLIRRTGRRSSNDGRASVYMKSETSLSSGGPATLGRQLDCRSRFSNTPAAGLVKSMPDRMQVEFCPKKQVSWSLSEARVSDNHKFAWSMSAWPMMQQPILPSASQRFRRDVLCYTSASQSCVVSRYFSGLDHAYCMHLLPTLLLICCPLDQPLINNESILYRLRMVHGFPCRLSIPRTAGTTGCCGVLQHAMVVHQSASHNRTLAALGSCPAIETLWAATI